MKTYISVYLLVHLVLNSAAAKANSAIDRPLSCGNIKSVRDYNIYVSSSDLLNFAKSMTNSSENSDLDKIGPRLLKGRVDGYYIHSFKHFGGKVLIPGDVLCQIDDFNEMTTCDRLKYDKYDQCRDKAVKGLWESLSRTKSQPNLEGKKASVIVIRGGNFLRLQVTVRD